MRKNEGSGRTEGGCRRAGTSRGRGHLRGCKGECRKILELLLERGWTVLRSKRHFVLEHEGTGQHITLARTSSDHRAARQSVTMLRRHLGLDLRPYI